MNLLVKLLTLIKPIKPKKMGIRLGNWDPLGLIFGVLDKLLRKNLISPQELKDILRSSLPPDMPSHEKDSIINSMVKTVPKDE